MTNMKITGFLSGILLLTAVGTLAEAPVVAPVSTNGTMAAKMRTQLPPYLEEDFNSACEKAKKEGRFVLVSLGREICGRCQKFYDFVKSGQVTIDAKRFVFIRLDVDNYEHREYFYSSFTPPDRKLPFVGVMDGDRSPLKEALSGSHTPAEYQALMKFDK